MNKKDKLYDVWYCNGTEQYIIYKHGTKPDCQRDELITENIPHNAVDNYVKSISKLCNRIIADQHVFSK